MGTGQTTLDDVYDLQYVKGLSATQISIVRLLKDGYYEAMAARQLHISRSTVNKLVKALEKRNLISPNRFSLAWRGKTKEIATGDPLAGRAATWNVSDTLDRYIEQNPFASGAITLCMPHNIRPKYPILSQRGEPDMNQAHHSRSRSIFIKSWKSKGPLRHQWHVTTREAVVSVELHPKVLIASRVNRTHIPAASREEATMIAVAQVQKGVDIWLREQGWNGYEVRLGSPSNVGPYHFAFPSDMAKKMLVMGGQITLPGVFADRSPEEHGMAFAEIETYSPAIADAVDRGLRNAANLNEEVGKAVASSIQDTLGPLAETVSSIEAHLMGGTTIQYQYQQLVGLLAANMQKMQAMEEEMRILKSGNEGT